MRFKELIEQDVKPVEMKIGDAKKAIEAGERLLVRRLPHDAWKLMDTDHKWNVHNYYARMPKAKS